MSAEHEGWDADPESAPATAQDYAGTLKEHAIGVLKRAGHDSCEYLPKATFEPASGAVVCGCGEFAPWSNDPDSPPWEASEAENDAAYGRLVRAVDPIESTLALIDPTQVYSPDDVERQILNVLYRLETGQHFERDATVKMYETKQAFEMAFAAAVRVNETLRTDQCKAQSMLDCQDQYAAMSDAEMVWKAAKATMHNLRSALTGYQSVARSVGSSFQAGGSQGAAPRSDRSPW